LGRAEQALYLEVILQAVTLFLIQLHLLVAVEARLITVRALRLPEALAGEAVGLIKDFLAQQVLQGKETRVAITFFEVLVGEGVLAELVLMLRLLM